MKTLLLAMLCTSIIFTMVDCKKEDIDTSTEDVPAPFQKIYGASDIYVDGDYVIVETTGLPDHKSPYYQNTEWESDMYEAYNGSNQAFMQNPNQIASFNYSFKIPLNPEAASSPGATQLGAIGVSLNGVPFYNQYAGPNVPLTDEINTFDQYNGHPTGFDNYHYHIEPIYLTASKGEDALLGFLLDGFPVYGPVENGQAVTNADLDDYHGHEHATADYPDGIYHYHITDADPYINGNGYYGTPGTYSQ